MVNPWSQSNPRAWQAEGETRSNIACWLDAPEKVGLSWEAGPRDVARESVVCLKERVRSLSVLMMIGGYLTEIQT